MKGGVGGGGGGSSSSGGNAPSDSFPEEASTKGHKRLVSMPF